MPWEIMGTPGTTRANHGEKEENPKEIGKEKERERKEKERAKDRKVGVSTVEVLIMLEIAPKKGKGKGKQYHAHGLVGEELWANWFVVKCPGPLPVAIVKPAS